MKVSSVVLFCCVGVCKVCGLCVVVFDLFNCVVFVCVCVYFMCMCVCFVYVCGWVCVCVCVRVYK